jgi:tetratricopeptide (TPR) repeat protein
LREASAHPAFGAWVQRAEQIAELTNTYDELVRLFSAVSADVVDEDEQLALVMRIAELARERLHDRALAKAQLARALLLPGGERRALSALEELYEQDGDHALLLDVLSRKADLAVEDDARKSILFRKASLCEQIEDSELAIATYRQILEIELDPVALLGLERLYRASLRWHEVVALYERELLDDATTPARRASLSFEKGTIHDREFGALDRTFDAYEDALRAVPMHAPTLAALEALMARPHTAVQAAEVLEPVYVARLDWRNVMRTIHARLAVATDAEERRALRWRLVKLHEEQEENYSAALEVTAELFAEDVADETTVRELERLARVANAEARLASIYAARLETIELDDAVTAQLAFRTGELFERLDNPSRALTFYRRAHAFDPEASPATFDAIDRLLAQTGVPSQRVALYRDSLAHRTAPDARSATLRAMAQIEEVELQDVDAAIASHRAIVEIDDTDVASLDALARLYTLAQRHRDLAELYRARAGQAALPEDEAGWRCLLAGVLVSHLENPTAALDEYVAVLDGVSPVTSEHGRAAGAALEQLLVEPACRARCVARLTSIYEEAGDWSKLVDLAPHRLLLVETVKERVEVLRETAMLLEERVRDINGAFARWKAAFQTDPSDLDTREHLERVAATLRRWDEVAGLYDVAFTNEVGPCRRDIGEALARVYDEKIDDPRRALETWKRLLQLDPSDARVLDEMDRLATLLSDWQTLVTVLAQRATVVQDVDEPRARLWRRIGEARRDMLDDEPGAIDAYERALELEPSSAFTLDNLIALYEARNDAARLVDLYRKRIALCEADESERKLALALDAARCYEIGLNDRREAIAILGEALQDNPSSVPAILHMESLLSAERMWPELLDNLRAQLDLGPVDGLPSREALLRRIAAIYANELEAFDHALAAYGDLLRLGYDKDVVYAVRDLGEKREELRRDAADMLLPIVTEAQDFDALAEVLELRLRTQTEPVDRAETLRALAHVAEASLSDLPRAEHALLRAFAETPDDEEIERELERLCWLAGVAGWSRYAEAIRDRATSTFDAPTNGALWLRLGKVYEHHLEDVVRGHDAYAAAAEQGGDSAAVLMCIERVCMARQDARGLADALERRVPFEEDSSAKATLYQRVADIQREDRRDAAQSLASLRLALECAPTHAASLASLEALLSDEALFDDAFDLLEAGYRASSRFEELGRVYARRVDHGADVGERTRRRLDLARVLELEANDVAGAQAALEAAVAEDPEDETSRVELERLASTTGAWASAVGALSRGVRGFERVTHVVLPAGSGSIAPSRVGAGSFECLGRWRRDHRDDLAGAEAAFARALEFEPENNRLLRSLEALLRADNRASERIAILLRLARTEASPASKDALFREAFSLAERVGDHAGAENVLRDVIAGSSTAECTWAVDALIEACEASGNYAEAIVLLDRRISAEDDPDAAARFRHRAADLAVSKLGDTARAATLYEDVLAHDPSDAVAAVRLKSAYRTLRRFRELADLLGSLINRAQDVDVAVELRLELAEVQRANIDLPDEAIATLRAILASQPDEPRAVEALLDLLDATHRTSDLLSFLAVQIERAQAHSDRVLATLRRLRLASTLETRANDPQSALEVYEAIVEEVPQHASARQAVARLAATLGQWERAAGALRTILDDLPDANAEEVLDVALRLASACEATGDEAGVERALMRAHGVHPNDTVVRARLLQLYERTSRWKELAEWLVNDAQRIEIENPYEPPKAEPTKRISVPPGGSSTPAAPSVPPLPPHVVECTNLLRRAADLHLVQRRAPADAVPVLEWILRIIPAEREVSLLLCDAYVGGGRIREAAAVLEALVTASGQRRTKELAHLQHRLGRLLAELGDKTAALTYFDAAFKGDPGALPILKDLGVLALELGDLERAQRTFRALLLQRLDASSGISKGEVFCYLGEVALKQGDRAKAEQMFERSVEHEPKSERAKELLASVRA